MFLEYVKKLEKTHAMFLKDIQRLRKNVLQERFPVHPCFHPHLVWGSGFRGLGLKVEGVRRRAYRDASLIRNRDSENARLVS